MSSIIMNLVVIELLANGGEICGTERLARMLGYRYHAFVRRKLNEMQAQQIVQIIRGNGRGHPNVIRLPRVCRKNRNSPGYPRKLR